MSKTTMTKFATAMMLYIICFSGCAEPERAAGWPDEVVPQGVVSTNLATGMMAEAILRDAAEVVSLAGPALQGRLSSEEIDSLQVADAIFTNGPGADDALWLPRYTFDQNRIYETTTRSFELDQFIVVEDHQIVHSHGPDGEHTHVWMVPYCWLDPEMALLQLDVVQQKLTDLYSGTVIEQDTLRDNAQSLQTELADAATLAQETRERLREKSVGVICSDPRLLYFARSLGVPSTHLKWFEIPDRTTAKKQLTVKIQTLTENLEPEARPKSWLLLWGQDSGSLNGELNDLADSVHIDLIETQRLDRDGNEISLPTRINGNYREIVSAAGP